MKLHSQNIESDSKVSTKLLLIRGVLVVLTFKFVQPPFTVLSRKPHYFSKENWSQLKAYIPANPLSFSGSTSYHIVFFFGKPLLLTHFYGWTINIIRTKVSPCSLFSQELVRKWRLRNNMIHSLQLTKGHVIPLCPNLSRLNFSDPDQQLSRLSPNPVIHISLHLFYPHPRSPF